MHIEFTISMDVLKGIFDVYKFWLGFLLYLAISKIIADKKDCPKLIRYATYPYIVVFGIVDIAINFSFGIFIFLEFPRCGWHKGMTFKQWTSGSEWTISRRVARYDHRIIQNPSELDNYRTKIGTWLANVILNPASIAVTGQPHV